MRFLKLVHQTKPPCEKMPSVFFPEDYSDPELIKVVTKTAKALCHSCPIIEECFTYALESNQRHGIWGGTLPSER
jgi:WhiB family redox-sensing transcriptional regulator